MGKRLSAISIHGFKSIRELIDFELKERNVLIGANGAGKSNFIDFFRLLRALALDGLAAHVTESGGADGFFFMGPQVTREIAATLTFDPNKFRFSLQPTDESELMVNEVATFYSKHEQPKWRRFPRGRREAGITSWRDQRLDKYPESRTIEGHVYDALSSWITYHFHDTSRTSPMRREGEPANFRELMANGGNLAAFLAHLADASPGIYTRIRETVQIVAPFFDDFLLEIRTKGDAEKIKLEWRQKGSTYPFQPRHLSDGMLRFIALTTALLQPTPPSTIIIDEPELGLHPVALRVLAALIHEVSVRTQFLLSTQSTALAGLFEPEDLIITERCEGATALRRLDADDLARWLDDYSLGELIEKNVIETGP